jgi:hypothetical protein
MNAHAKPRLPATGSDTSLGAVLAALAPHDHKPLTLAYPDGLRVRSGYHVTEVKAGSFVTLDCGGNPDAWHETVLQVEDLPGAADGRSMTVGKFRAILAKVAGKVALDLQARLTLEVSRPLEPMRVFDVAGVEAEGEDAVLRMAARPAICKPRHRAAAACCAPAGTTEGACCAEQAIPVRTIISII